MTTESSGPVDGAKQPAPGQVHQHYDVSLSPDEIRLIRSALEGFKASYSHHEHVYRQIDEILTHLPKL